MRIVSLLVLATFTSLASPTTGPQPAPPRRSADPPCQKCVRIFDGESWAGWEHDPANWTIVDGAMRGFGPGARSAFTQADYGNFRLIVTSRMAPVNKDHLGVLFWGPRPELDRSRSRATSRSSRRTRRCGTTSKITRSNARC